MFEELFKDTGIAGVLDSAELSYESSCAMLRRETLLLRWLFEHFTCRCGDYLKNPAWLLLASKLKLLSSYIVIVLQVHLQYDKLYVEGKCFVWNDHRGKVTTTSQDDGFTVVVIILLMVT